MDADWIADARARIDSRGELPRSTRIELRRLLTDADGEAAWASIEATCARHVRHHWDLRFGQQSEPWDLLDDAVEAKLSGADWRFGGCHTMLLDALAGPDLRPTYAGFAAYMAAWVTAMHPAPVDGGSELEIEVDDWDACFWASLAACGGAVWEEPPVSDDSQRRAFWEWYLAEAAHTGREA
jgi:hypothetical protein